MDPVRVQQLVIYPIKSCKGITVNESRVLKTGLEQDRLAMLVDERQQFVSQRRLPLMSLIRVTRQPDHLQVSYPGEPDLIIGNVQEKLLSHLDVTIWDDVCKALPSTDEVDRWFSRILGEKVRFVHYDGQYPRPTDPDFSEQHDVVSFADGFPLLLTSTGSLDDLNQRLPKPVSMDVFRPNLVVDAAEAFIEDGWRQIRIGEVIFDMVKRCSRCSLTTVDQDTGEMNASQEPLKTLATYRKGEGGVYFGVNLIPRNGGSIRVGDRLEVIS